jgi:acetoacetyl-CoA synthetase
MAHVPAAVAQVADLPVTFNGKLSERAARDALHGRPVVNLAALRNPECLDAIREHQDLRVR